MRYLGKNFSDGDINSGVEIIQSPEIEFPDDTTAVFIINKSSMSYEPTGFSYSLVEVDYTGLVITGGQTFSGNPTSDPFTVTGLKPGTYYKLSMYAKYNSIRSNTVTLVFGMPIDSNAASAGATVLDPTKASASKSFLRLNNGIPKDPKSHRVAWRTFEGLNLNSFTTSTILVGGKQINVPVATTETYYAFGTTMYLDSIIEKTKQSSGFGFFLKDSGNTGYFISIETTETAAAKNKKEVRILKVEGGDSRVLKDTQKNTVTSLNGVYGGRSYKIDVKVRVKENSVVINAYINGFKITVVDSNSKYTIEDKEVVNKIIKPSQRVGVFTKQGQAIFDYVYATDITAAQYKNQDYTTNIYEGLFSNDFLDLNFGEIIYNNSDEEDNLARPTSLDEFGTTVREIKKSKFIFNNAPAFPIDFSTGLNKSVRILGQKKSSFGGEVYVLNNSSALTPLSDQQSASFYIYGNTISPSGILEYQTDEIPEYINQEPVIFESKWLQNLSDVEALGQWIKSNIINKGKNVVMEIFGNPLICVGDIVTIKYTYQNLGGVEEFIVTSVEHSYNEGLVTNITCRTL